MPKKDPKNPMPQELIDKFKAMTPTNERVNVNELPTWVKLACVRVELLGYTWKQAAEDMGKHLDTLRQWRRSPACHTYREYVREQIDDPRFLAEAVLRSTELEMGMDFIWAIDAAKRAGDYKEVRQGTKDILLSSGLLKAKAVETSAGGQNLITINLALPEGMSRLSPTTVSSDYSTIELGEADVEVIE